MAITKRIDIGNLPISKIHTKVDDLKKRFEGLHDDLEETVPGTIVDNICKAGVSMAKQLNATAPKTGLADNKIFAAEHKDTPMHGAIIMEGENAVYDEFGTGEEGAADPHPLKGGFGLNPYNSGPFIFYNEFTGRYQWRYRPMAGKPYFTQSGLTSGTPSGKQMYNTLQYVREIKGDIVFNNVEKSLRRAMGRK